MINAGIILYDEEKRVLIQHRTKDAPRYPGKWGLFGGAIEEGETPEEAVKRECMEELGYPLENPKLILIDNEGIKAYIFVEKYDKSKKLILKEGDDMKWVGFEELKNLDLVGSAKNKLMDIAKNMGWLDE